jgi:hypothetical protein
MTQAKFEKRFRELAEEIIEKVHPGLTLGESTTLGPWRNKKGIYISKRFQLNSKNETKFQEDFEEWITGKQFDPVIMLYQDTIYKDKGVFFGSWVFYGEIKSNKRKCSTIFDDLIPLVDPFLEGAQLSENPEIADEVFTTLASHAYSNPDSNRLSETELMICLPIVLDHYGYKMKPSLINILAKHFENVGNIHEHLRKKSKIE